MNVVVGKQLQTCAFLFTLTPAAGTFPVAVNRPLTPMLVGVTGFTLAALTAQFIACS